MVHGNLEIRVYTSVTYFEVTRITKIFHATLDVTKRHHLKTIHRLKYGDRDGYEFIEYN